MKWFIIFILFPGTCFSQTYLGLKGSANLSFATKNNTNPRVTLSGGVFLQHNISNRFTIREEALLAFDGYSEMKTFEPIVVDGDTSNYIVGIKKVQYQVNSIEIPALFIAKFGKNIHPYIGAGGSIKFAVLSRSRIFVFHREQFYQDITSQSIGLNVIGVLGVEKTIKEIPIHLELRHTFGLNQMVNSQKLSSVSILFGFKI
jgi:hypothetical protein